jgi:hypothetical protein
VTLVNGRRSASPVGVSPAGVARWRTLVSGTATPHRLWRLGAMLVVVCLAAALVSLVTGSARSDAVGAGGARIAGLATDANQLYRSLNEADAMASSGFVSGGAESPTVRARYDDHLARASDRLVHAASLLPPGGRDTASIDVIASRLPRYAAMVETARTLGSAGSPLAQDSLGDASRLMRATILPAADELRQTRAAALAANYEDASAFPVVVLLIAAVALVGVCLVAVREQRRTHRILNAGLVAAGVMLTAALLWWLVASLGASGRLDSARGHNDVAAALDEARVAALQARAFETTSLADDDGSASSEEEFTSRLQRLLGQGGLLDTAAGAAGDTAAADVESIRDAATAWQDAHGRLRALADSGDQQGALASAIGSDPQGSGLAFDRLSAALADVLGTEQTALAIDVRGADSALTGIAEGPALLALLAAAAAATGIGQRVWEYR